MQLVWLPLTKIASTVPRRTVLPSQGSSKTVAPIPIRSVLSFVPLSPCPPPPVGDWIRMVPPTRNKKPCNVHRKSGVLTTEVVDYAVIKHPLITRDDDCACACLGMQGRCQAGTGQ